MAGSSAPQDINVGDVVTLRKPHPCGVNRWEIMRLGADVRLRCTGCSRIVALDRHEFGRRYKRHITPEE